jgi:hypothetical protein
MVAKDSTSYPYLAVAQHHGVPYSDVLAYAERVPSATLQRSEAWQLATWEAWECQQKKVS